MPDAGRDHIPAVDIPNDLHGGASCWLCSHLGLRQSSDYPAIVACQGGVATVDEGSTNKGRRGCLRREPFVVFPKA
jgi:hypothetical protein